MFSKASALDPSFAEAFAGIADCDSYSFLMKQDDAVVRSMLDNSAKAITLAPHLAAEHASRGLACWAAEMPSEAEAEYKRALDLNPNLYEANYFYGRYCRAVGRYEQAAELFERAVEVRPVDYKSLGLLQTVYELLERPVAAASAGRRAAERAERELQSRPENAVAAIHGAMALASLGEKTRSRQLLRQALSTEPDDPAILFNAACAYSKLGDVNLALDLLEKVHPLISPADQRWTETDPDLRPLHGSPRFQSLLASPAGSEQPAEARA